MTQWLQKATKFLEKLRLKVPGDSAVSVLSICSNTSRASNDICIPTSQQHDAQWP